MKTFLQLARDLMKPGEEIAALMTADEADLWHGATGVAGEAGELLDAVKKHVVYKKALDRENVVEELADLRFYMAALMNRLGITEIELTEVINAKLGKRYASGSYSNDQAQARADKAEASSLPVMPLDRRGAEGVFDALGRKCRISNGGNVWLLDNGEDDGEDNPGRVPDAD